MDRLEQLRSAMILSIHGGVDRALVKWVSEHHGAPRSLDSTKLRAIVTDFDTFLMQPGVEDSEFTRAMIRLRNVFARHAKMSTPATVTIGGAAPAEPAPQPLVTDESASCAGFDANALLAEALSQLLGDDRWSDTLKLVPLSERLPAPVPESVATPRPKSARDDPFTTSWTVWAGR